MHKIPSPFVTIIIVLTALVSCVSNAGDANNSDALQAATVVIGAIGDEILISESAGHSNIELKVKATEASVFRIASLTKQFTAVAILALAEDGLLELDDPVEAHLPQPAAHWRAITIRQLLSHTSGLTGNLTPILESKEHDRTSDELIALYADIPATAAPGETWEYGNLNYWILGKIIEAASGYSYEDYISDRVLHPANLTQTAYGHADVIIPGRSAGYEVRLGSEIKNARYFSTTIGYAAGGFVSSPQDMARWYGALANGKIITAESLAEALIETRTNNGRPTGYGLGWYIDKIDDRVIAHHGGSTIGYVSYIYWSPETKHFAGVFQNFSDTTGEPSQKAVDEFKRLSAQNSD